MLFRVVLFIALLVLTACSSLSTKTADYTVLEEHVLLDELKETSGLYCPELGSAFTVNDSGNQPIIYHIDDTGRIIGKQTVAIENIDWEALTGDNEYFYIGDIGNNFGKRDFVQIHAVPKQTSDSANDITTLRVFYNNNLIANNDFLNHDFDAESLINLDDKLLLFSKSWKTGTLFIYQLNKTQAKQYVNPVSTIEGLPGMVTGGGFDHPNNRFILLGYQLNGFGGFYPFITILNRDLTLHKSFKLTGYGQVEGMCVTPNGEVWFTQESSFFSNHKIVKLKLAK